MAHRRTIRPDRRPAVHLAFSDVTDGDLAVTGSGAELTERRERIAPHPWTWLHQVHGSRVVVVHSPGDGAAEEADAAVTAVPGAALAVHTADCAGVLLWSTAGEPVIGAAHAGWRGLAAGVLEATVAAMADLGGTGIRYQIGPCISGPAYEFGESDLEMLVRRFGPTVRTLTAAVRPALDLRAGVRVALGGVGSLEDGDGPDRCTATGPGWYSWRARRDEGRQASVIWMEPNYTRRRGD